MTDLIFCGVPYWWHCDPYDHPVGDQKVVLILEVSDGTETRYVVHEDVSYDETYDEWCARMAAFKSEGRDNDGSWRVIAWAYKPYLNRLLTDPKLIDRLLKNRKEKEDVSTETE